MNTKGFKMLPGQALALALIGILIFGAVGQVSAAGVVRYAKPNGVSSGSCLTWGTACKLPRALAVAIPGDRIWAAKGMYKPTFVFDPPDVRTATFLLKNGVALYGGFAGTETSLNQRSWRTRVTILSGDIGHPYPDVEDNAYHVVLGISLNASAVLDGFTISGGNADDSPPYSHGGGMYNIEGSPTLRNLTFSGNHAIWWGGGLWNWGSSPTLTNVIFSSNTSDNDGGGLYNDKSSPTLTNVTFSGNTADISDSRGGRGGGLYNYSSSPTLTNVTFSGNSAPYGGGTHNYKSSPTLTNVTFSGNTAGAGGGMLNDESSPTLTKVTFRGNTASMGGGGMLNSYYSSPTLTNVTFSSNTASMGGGGMYNGNSSPTLTNVTFSANTATSGSGGGMYNYESSSPALTNVTFSGNTAASTVAGMRNDNSDPTLTNVTFSGNIVDDGIGAISNLNDSDPIIHNSVFWGNGTMEIASEDATSGPAIVDSIVAGGCPSGSICDPANVYSLDPVLGPLQNNGGFTPTMALGAGSAAIDKGNNATCALQDQRGIPRPQDGNGDGKSICDLGAYEALPGANLKSIAAQDGWVLETNETSNVGGTINAGALTFRVGDHALRSQYRAILSFNTGGIPDNAVIASAALILKRQSVNPAGSNPFNLLQGMLIDVRRGFIGSSPGLQAADFQAAGHKTVGPFKPTPAAGVYTINLPSTAYPYLNKTAASGGLTQLRLRFKLDDNNNATANFISFFSGNSGTASYRPTLIITYYVP